MSSLKRKTQELDLLVNPPNKCKVMETNEPEDSEDIMEASLEELQSQTRASNYDGNTIIGGGKEIRGKIAIPRTRLSSFQNNI